MRSFYVERKFWVNASNTLVLQDRLYITMPSDCAVRICKYAHALLISNYKATDWGASSRIAGISSCERLISSRNFAAPMFLAFAFASSSFARDITSSFLPAARRRFSPSVRRRSRTISSGSSPFASGLFQRTWRLRRQAKDSALWTVRAQAKFCLAGGRGEEYGRRHPSTALAGKVQTPQLPQVPKK